MFGTSMKVIGRSDCGGDGYVATSQLSAIAELNLHCSFLTIDAPHWDN